MAQSIMLVGEAWGEREEEARQPFVGPSGSLLNGLLFRAGIRREDCFVTNVFNLRPRPTNDVTNLCGTKGEALSGFPALRSGKYIRAEFAAEISRLADEVRRVQPTVVVALGATPAWAFLHTSGIKNTRGTPGYAVGQLAAALDRPLKVLPTYHPAAVMREWRLRPIVLADLVKVKREAEFPDIRRPRREVWIEPSLDDLGQFHREFIEPAECLSIDIETIGDQISCVGVAPSWERAIVVPFIDRTRPDGNYWPSLSEELTAWRWVREWAAMPKAKVGQNFLYDMHRMFRTYGIACPNTDDTMLLHHALQPEMEKGLGFLGSLYTDEASWKLMRHSGETLKKED